MSIQKEMVDVLAEIARNPAGLYDPDVRIKAARLALELAYLADLSPQDAAKTPPEGADDAGQE